MIAYKYAYISMIAYKITRKMFWRAANETSEEKISFHLSKKQFAYISMFAYISTYHVLK